MGSKDRQRRKQSLLKSQGKACFYCGKSIDYKSATLDHIVPYALGKDNSLGNLVLACKSCNQSKSKTPVFRYLDKIGSPLLPLMSVIVYSDVLSKEV
jgi:5-methylcytosine-specific restriction endonuclease McrA